MVSPLDRLARKVMKLDQQVKGLSGTPQLAFSAIENGSVDEYDEDGTLVSVIGKQYDGTHGAVVVSGPVPPVPNMPLVTGGLSLNIGWDGTFVNDAGAQDITIPAPMDFSRVELHASRTPGFSADAADTLIDTIESPRGGTRPAMLAEGTWYAVLVTRSASGKRSAQSAEASAEVAPPVGSDVDVDALREEFEQADAALHQALADNAGKLATLTEGPMPEGTARNIAAEVGQFMELSVGQLIVGDAAMGNAVAEELAARVGSFLKLYANQVFIGEGGNLFPAEFTDPGWAELTGATFSSTGGKTGGSSLLLPVSANQIGSYFGATLADRPKAPRLMPGESYRIKAAVRGDKNVVAGGAAIFVRLYSLREPTAYTWATPSTITNTEAIAANTWGEIDGKFTVPEGATDTYAVIGLYSQTKNTTAALRFSDLRLQQAVTPSLIVDGFFQGLRVIGASIETNTAANRGVKMTDAGLFAYDSTGKETLRFDGANSILTGATLRTAASGARIQLSETGLHGWGADNTQYLKADSGGLEMTGSISTKGKTAEAVPRDIAVRLTTVVRDTFTGGAYANPGLVFDDGVNVETLAESPGIYSPDGKAIFISGRTDFSGKGTFSLSQEKAELSAGEIDIGAGGLWAPTRVNVYGGTINVGFAVGDILKPSGSAVNLLGTVKVNGNLLGVQHAEYQATFSLASGPTNRRPSAFVLDAAASKNNTFASLAEAGTLNLAAGVYAVTARVDCKASMGTDGRVALVNGTTETITYMSTPIVSEWDGGVAVPNLYLPAAGKIAVLVRQNSGAARNCTVRVVIEKIK